MRARSRFLSVSAVLVAIVVSAVTPFAATTTLDELFVLSVGNQFSYEKKDNYGKKTVIVETVIDIRADSYVFSREEGGKVTQVIRSKELGDITPVEGFVGNGNLLHATSGDGIWEYSQFWLNEQGQRGVDKVTCHLAPNEPFAFTDGSIFLAVNVLCEKGEWRNFVSGNSGRIDMKFTIVGNLIVKSETKINFSGRRETTQTSLVGFKQATPLATTTQ
jgi:hypothetical protein